MKKLTAWKEIAEHLGVSVRTAQKYEKEKGLPVQRLGDGPRPPVFASDDDLDRWLEETSSNGENGAFTVNRVEYFRGSRWFAVLATILAIVILGWFLWSRLGPAEDGESKVVSLPADQSPEFVPGADPIPVRCEVLNRFLRVMDDKDRLIWQKPFPQHTLKLTADAWACEVVDLIPGSPPEILFNYFDQNRLVLGGKAICFSSTGTELWQFDYGKSLTKGDRRFSQAYSGRFIEFIEIDHKLVLLSITWHKPFHPAQVALVDPLDGTLIKEYFHPGYLYSHALTDLDGDSRPELVVGGVNNPGKGPGRAGLAVLSLDLRRPTAQAGFFNEPETWRILHYTLFPRPDSVVEAAETPKVIGISPEPDGRIRLQVGMWHDKHLYYVLKVTDGFEMQVDELRLSDGLEDHHDKLVREGTLASPFGPDDREALFLIGNYSSTPDGNLVDPALR